MPTRWSAPGWRGRTWRRRRWRDCAASAGARSRCGSRSRSGSRSRPGLAAAAPTPARYCGLRPKRSTGSGGWHSSWAPACPPRSIPPLAWAAGGAERPEPLPPPAEFGAVVVPGETGLRAGEAYAELERLGGGRSEAELAEIGDRLREAAAPGRSPLDYADLMVNDLDPAARSLDPGIEGALAALSEAGARHVMVAGSGPTAVGICDGLVEADAVAAALPPRYAGAVVAAAAEGAS